MLTNILKKVGWALALCAAFILVGCGGGSGSSGASSSAATSDGSSSSVTPSSTDSSNSSYAADSSSSADSSSAADTSSSSASGVCEGASDPVACTLNALGVNTSATPREVLIAPNNRQPLPDSFVPIPRQTILNSFDELLLLDLEPGEDARPLHHILKATLGGTGNIDSMSTLFQSANTAAWLQSGVVRTAAAIDLSGKGRQDTVVVYRNNSVSNAPVNLVVIGDHEAGFPVSAPQIIADAQSVRDIVIEPGDFDGDGQIDLAVALLTNAGAQLFFLRNDNGTLVQSGWPQRTLTPQEFSAGFNLSMQAGNIDYDSAQELVVVTNVYEHTGSSGGIVRGHPRYYIYDDATTNFAELASGRVNLHKPNGEIVSMATADIALGDVTGMGVDSIIIGGLSHVGHECYFMDEANPEYVVNVLDIQPRNRQLLRTYSAPYVPVNGSCNSGSSRTLYHVHVNSGDIRGTGAHEIQVNNLIFDSLKDSASSEVLTLWQTINSSNFFWSGGTSSGFFTWQSSSVVIGDFNFDSRDNIAFVNTMGGYISEVQIWGLNVSGNFTQLHAIPLEMVGFEDNSPRAQLLAINVDRDSTGLAYSNGSHRLIFTEPLVIAALAAPPCSEAYGQDIGVCQTAFGKGKTGSVTKETGWTVTAGFSAGFEVSYSFLGIELGSVSVIQSVEAETRRFRDETYSLTRTVTYTTGPIEDSVIFTTIPMDVYTYVITSHPNTTMIGGEVQVRMPREPITIMADLASFNASLEDPDKVIGSNVFQHTPGDPESYPSLAERNAILAQFPGFQSDEVDVGVGSGFVTTSISVYEETSGGTSHGVSTTLDISATTLGVVTGLSIGGGVDSAITYSSGSESIYEGSVAQLPSATFNEYRYRFGLFTYVYKNPQSQQEFEVINYWTRPQ